MAAILLPNSRWPLAGDVDDDDRRFRRILLGVAIPYLLLALVLPYLTLPEPPEAEPVPTQEPQRYVEIRLRPEPIPVPPPTKETAPHNEVAAKPKPTPPKAAPAPRPVDPKQQAENAGVMAMRESLSALRNTPSLGKLDRGPLTHGGGEASTSQRELLTAKVGTASNGISTRSLSRDTGGGVALGGRSVSQVSSPIGAAAATESGGRRNKKAARSDESIQLVFDRNKGAIFSIYNRALREKPALQGKMVLRLTIAPSGEVLKVGVVSSELKDSELEEKLLLRVKRFNFGAEDVDTVTVTYPIEFFPS